MAVFKRSSNSWHGHNPYEGERRHVIFNWLASDVALLKNTGRHKLSAPLKTIGLWNRQEAMMDEAQPLNQTAAPFLFSLSHAEHLNSPYHYWLLKGPLPSQVCTAIANLPFPPPTEAALGGKRETNNSTRAFFSPEVQQRHAVCREVTSAFKNTQVVLAIEAVTGTKLQSTQLRMEYYQDIDGFQLEPHADIPVKKFTMLAYLSDDLRLSDAGTDVHDRGPGHRIVATAPYELQV